MHSLAEFGEEPCCSRYFGVCRLTPGMLLGPADGHDQESQQYIAKVLWLAWDIFVNLVQQDHHFLSARAVETIGDELIDDDRRVVGPFAGAFNDFAIAHERFGQMGDGEVPIVGEEVAQLHVFGKVKHDHSAVRVLPIIRCL